ncbi:MAG: hypothetical protein KIS87_09535 [Phycisphaeraceae bacterium]|nr:hypothetical protein [Phycisphaeraceae bacterium]
MPEQPTTLDDPAAGVEDLQRQVDSLLSRLDAELPAEGGGEAPASGESEVASEERIEALDQQLAALSEELLQQDRDAEIETARPAAPSAAIADSPGEPQAGASLARQAPTGAAPPAEASAVVPAVTASSAPAAASISTAPIAVEAVGVRQQRDRASLTDSICISLARAVEPIAQRVSGMPRGVRDSIGWIGAMTLFYAACVWTVVLVLRGPGIEPPDGPPPEVASAPAAQPADIAGKN